MNTVLMNLVQKESHRSINSISKLFHEVHHPVVRAIEAFAM